jgi:arylsulfatase A-like enzyme/Tfp pilus assembly protein PilF
VPTKSPDEEVWLERVEGKLSSASEPELSPFPAAPRLHSAWRMLDFFRFNMQVFRALLLVLPVLGAGVANAPTPASAASASAKSPNIILITLDTTRADRMGFLGSKRGLTPNLDALARQSVIFTRAYAQVPLTTPSHAVLLTGTYPQFNHVEDLGSPLGKDLPYLPDLLHGYGYHTAAFVGGAILDPAGSAPGFERGFDVYDAHFHQRKPGEDRYHSIERRAEDVSHRAIDWLSRHPQGPFFIWIHFYDAHDPYDPPEPFKTRYASEPYDGEIAYTDSVIGELMDVLRKHEMYNDTVIAVAADHGEAFGEHGEERHGMFLYDETIHVPLLLKLPAGRFAGKRLREKRIDERVALAEMAPSLLEAAGIPAPATMQAPSLFPLIDGAISDAAKIDTATTDAAQSASGGKGKPPEQSVYSESKYAHLFGWSSLSSWRNGKYLYILAPKRELYDQSADPGAVNNLAPAATAVANTLESQLADFWQKTSSVQTVPTKLDPEQAENLRELGYMTSDSVVANRKDKGAIDPKDKIDIANRFHRSAVDFEEDRYDEGIAGLRELLRLEPDMPGVYMELGRALSHEQRHQEALQIYRIAVEKMPDSAAAHYELGWTLVKTKQWEAALPEVRAAVGYTPDSAQLHFFLGFVELHLKQVPEATAEFENSLKIDSDHFEANLKYGEMLLLEGRLDDALPKLRRASKLDPVSAEAHEYLADAYEQLGQAEDERRERAKAAELKNQAPQ